MGWMMLLMAAREVRRNGLRSILTTLGILIGVGAMITLVTLGRSASSQISSQIASMGSNLLLVVPEAEERGPVSSPAPPLSNEDARVLRRAVAGVVHLVPTASAPVTAVYGDRNHATTLIGTSNEYFATRNYALARGREFDAREEAGMPACVLGASLREALFKQRDPVGQTLRVGSLSCPIVGFLESKGRSSMGPDQDDIVLIPLAAYQRRFAGREEIGAIFVSARSEAQVPTVQRSIQDILRQRRRIGEDRPDNFKVHDMKQLTGTLNGVTAALTALLGSIAGVSLVVGGIGIMNIMLVSVTERTREIGVRLALGALTSDVLMQFLTEAILLSLIGGALGALLGLAVSFGVAQALGLPFGWHWDVVLLAVAFAATIGVVFGFLPAHKAARMNPIAALARE